MVYATFGTLRMSYGVLKTRNVAGSAFGFAAVEFARLAALPTRPLQVRFAAAHAREVNINMHVIYIRLHGQNVVLTGLTPVLG